MEFLCPSNDGIGNGNILNSNTNGFENRDVAASANFLCQLWNSSPRRRVFCITNNFPELGDVFRLDTRGDKFASLSLFEYIKTLSWEMNVVVPQLQLDSRLRLFQPS